MSDASRTTQSDMKGHKVGLLGPRGRNIGYVGPLEANVGKLEAQLTLWAVQIDDLAAKADKAGARATIEYRQSIDDLKIKRAMAQEKFDEFKAAGSGKWEEFKTDIEHAWSELAAAFSNLNL